MFFKSQTSNLKNNLGFSLLEVLIAMSIMASAAMLLYVAWSGNQIRVQKMAINNKAAFLLEEIMSELEIKYGGQKISQLPDNEEGVFENHPRFTWAMESKDFEMPDLSSILISGEQGDETMLTIINQLTDHLNESIKEMKVTVRYTLGKKSLKYSATTFLVNFNRSIPLGGAGSFGGGAGGSQ